MACLAGRLRALQSALGCLQDALRVHGPATWQEQYTHVVADDLAQELGRLREHAPADGDGSVPDVMMLPVRLGAVLHACVKHLPSLPCCRC